MVFRRLIKFLKSVLALVGVFTIDLAGARAFDLAPDLAPERDFIPTTC
jgi:hypothetical protein